MAHDILARDLSLDTRVYARALGLTPRSLDEVITSTVAACRPCPHVS